MKKSPKTLFWEAQPRPLPKPTLREQIKGLPRKKALAIVNLEYKRLNKEAVEVLDLYRELYKPGAKESLKDLADT